MSWLKEWRSARAGDKTIERAKHRAETLSASALADWIDTTIVDLGVQVDKWRKIDNPVLRLDALRDGVTSSEILLCLLEELCERQRIRVERKTNA